MSDTDGGAPPASPMPTATRVTNRLTAPVARLNAAVNALQSASAPASSERRS
jgi:hypothetical protein